ncbi:MAG: DUF5329 domain-containing protein [Deltaproteobacteria bacterium]|jgi:hypothetical protein|nr:DUF5329 domain-containing protein [Deltaproteobacteria bacterium]
MLLFKNHKYNSTPRSSTLALLLVLAALNWLARPAMALEGEELALTLALIKSIDSQKDLIFIRNGKEYNSAQAAAHLKRKLSQAGAKIQTVENFIELLASKSSVSGQPYYIKRPNQSQQTAQAYFTDLLNEIKAQKSFESKAKSK